MGCDIHMFPELRHVRDGRVAIESLGEFDVYRDYSLFAQLANVRGYGGFEAKGLPDKMGFTAEVHYDEEKEDAHSMTHFTFEELESSDTEVYDYKSDNWYLMLKAIAEKHGKQKARLVIWFDN